MNKCSWSVGNGETVEFDIYSKNEGWNKVSGLYIFAKQSPQGWVALYIGQTDDFSARLPDHERLEEAVRCGATHIHATKVEIQPWKDRWEKALIAIYQPPLNVQHR